MAIPCRNKGFGSFSYMCCSKEAWFLERLLHRHLSTKRRQQFLPTPPQKNRLWMSRETVSIGSWILFLLILFEAVGILQESTVSLTVWLIQFELNLGTGTWHWEKSAGEENTVFLAPWHPQSLWKSSWKKGMHHKLYFPICFEAIKYPRKTRWWFQILFNVHPYLGKWSNLANIFQMGWNHQLVVLSKGVVFSLNSFGSNFDGEM